MRIRRSDRGFTLVLFAVVLIVLLVFTAFAIDIGSTYAARRADQNAADSGALAAAQIVSSGSGTVTSAATQARTIANDTLALSTPLTNAQWNSCDAANDPGRLAISAPGISCVTFNTGLTRARVRIPYQENAAFFAQVVGVDSFEHSAFAIAGPQRVGFGSVLPFGMPGGAGAGDGYVCLKTNSQGQADGPCSVTTGNFGYLDFGYFGNEETGTLGFTQNYACGSGGTSDRIENNIAVGVDHALRTGGTQQLDTALCASNPNGDRPNATNTQTGGTDHVQIGLVSGTSFTDGDVARLRRGNYGAQRDLNLAWTSVDDNALWTFIDSTVHTGSGPGNDLPRSCELDQFETTGGVPTLDHDIPDAVRSHLQPDFDRTTGTGSRTTAYTGPVQLVKLMQRCFWHYQHDAGWRDPAPNGSPSLSASADPRVGCQGSSPCTDPIFTLNSSVESPDIFDIQQTPRFAYVPELVQTTFPPGQSVPVDFATFRAVYVQRTVWGTGSNTIQYDPGSAPTASIASNESLREVTAFVFPADSLPGHLGDPDAAFQPGTNTITRLVR